MAKTGTQDKNLKLDKLLENIAEWVKTARKHIGFGEQTIDHQPMKSLKFTPSGYERLFSDEEQEQAIDNLLHKDWSEAVRVEHNALCFAQEFREIMVFEEGLRYYCSRRPSIIAAADNLERFARDTKKEFSKP